MPPQEGSRQEKNGLINLHFKCTCGCLRNTGYRTNLQVAESVAEFARKMPCHEFKKNGICEGSKNAT